MNKTENIIEEFYKALASGDERKARRIHIPRSDVFYVRQAIFCRTGKWYTLEHVEWAMKEEGMLDD